MDYRLLLRQNEGAVLRIRFKDGDVFDLRQVRDTSDAAGEPDTWTGFIVAREGLSERRQQLHPIGGGLDFHVNDIESIDIVKA